jgi:hypothetical protein
MNLTGSLTGSGVDVGVALDRHEVCFFMLSIGVLTTPSHRVTHPKWLGEERILSTAAPSSGLQLGRKFPTEHGDVRGTPDTVLRCSSAPGSVGRRRLPMDRTQGRTIGSSSTESHLPSAVGLVRCSSLGRLFAGPDQLRHALRVFFPSDATKCPSPASRLLQSSGRAGMTCVLLVLLGTLSAFPAPAIHQG